MKKRIPLIILLVLSFAVHFAFLSHPAQVVFDEVHFGKFVSAYFTHEYYFDIHPPLGKLMIAGFSKIFGYNGNFNFLNIGENFSGGSLFVLRFLPAFFGALLAGVIYEFILLLGLSKKAAFLGGFLVIFDNAILVQSKFILVDIFLLFFGFCALYFFFLAKKTAIANKQYLFYAISAVFAGLAFSIKWTGVSFFGIIWVYIFWDFFKNKNFKKFIRHCAVFIILPFLVYVSVFAIHFSLLKKSGPGDAFMSPAFQETLLGSPFQTSVKPLSFWGKFIELNKAMYIYNASITATHPDASRWYEWPILRKPIWYWTQSLGQKSANIYFVGNPVVWFFAGLSVIFCLISFFSRELRKKLSPWIYLVVLGYFCNLLPFIFIGRITFLYHYLPSLMFGILTFVLVFDKILKPYFERKRSLKFFYSSFLVLVVLVFLVLAPISYGFAVSPSLNHFYSNFVNFLH